MATALTVAPTSSDLVSIEPDPFDPSHIFPNSMQMPLRATIAIYPLIYSSGPDKVRGIAANFSPAPKHSTINNNPYTGDKNGLQVGTQKDIVAEQSVSGLQTNGWLDNIHNHLIGARCQSGWLRASRFPAKVGLIAGRVPLERFHRGSSAI